MNWQVLSISIPSCMPNPSKCCEAITKPFSKYDFVMLAAIMSGATLKLLIAQTLPSGSSQQLKVLGFQDALDKT